MVLSEIADVIKRWDEVYLLERLNITSEDLVDRFMDIIEELADELEDEIKDDSEEEFPD